MTFLPTEHVGDALLVLSCLAILVGAFAQAITGMAFVLVCGAVLVTALGPETGLATALTLAIVANLFPLVAHRHDVDARRTLMLLLPAIAATPLLALVLGDLDSDTGAALAGAAILLAAAMLASGLRWHAARGRRGAIGAGVASAAMNYLGGVGGPAAGMYLANADWPAPCMRATLQAHLLALNVVTLSLLGFVAVPLVFVAALVVGSLAGIAAAGGIPDGTVRSATLVLAAAGGAAVLLQALV